MDFVFRNLLFYGIIILAFWISWKLGVKVIDKKKGIWAGAGVSVISSAFLLTPGGYYFYLTEPDMIGQGITVYFYIIAFILINAINIFRLILKNV